MTQTDTSQEEEDEEEMRLTKCTSTTQWLGLENNRTRGQGRCNNETLEVLSCGILMSKQRRIAGFIT